MSINCNCPVCLFARGKISENELEWYLKGEIEAYNRILNSHKTPANLRVFESIEAEIKALKDDSEMTLSDLKLDKRPKSRSKLKTGIIIFLEFVILVIGFYGCILMECSRGHW